MNNAERITRELYGQCKEYVGAIRCGRLPGHNGDHRVTLNRRGDGRQVQPASMTEGTLTARSLSETRYLTGARR